MILRRMRVQGIRCFRNAVEINGCGDGLNLIFAPNETGKSTLVEAVGRALFDRYAAGGAAIDALRPWGTSLSPEIELEFDVEGKRYRLHKRLLDDPSSILDVYVNGVPTRQADRDQADDFVRSLLQGEVAPRGGTKRSHWGLARTLWCLQRPERDGGLEVSSAVQSRLHAALPGGQTFATQLDDLQTRVNKRYAGHFTETGKIAAASSLKKLEDTITVLEQQLPDVERGYAMAQQAAEQLDQATRERERLDGEAQVCAEKVEQYQQAAQDVAALRSRIVAARAEEERAERDHSSAAGARERYEQARAESVELRDKLEALQGRLDDTITSRKAADTLRQESQDALQAAQESRRQADRRRQRGQKTNQANELAQTKVGLAEKAQTLDTLEAQLQREQQALKAMPSPTDKQVARAQDLAHHLARLQTQLEVAGLQVTLKLERDQEVALEGGAETDSRSARAGDTLAYTAGAAVNIHLRDVAHIRVTSGAQEPAELEEKLRVARESLDALLSPFGVADAQGLLKQQLSHEQKKTHVDGLGDQIAQVASPYTTVAAVRDEQAKVSLQLTQLLNELGISADGLAELPPQDESALEEACRQAQGKEDDLAETLQTREKDGAKLWENEQKLLTERARLKGEHERQTTIMETVLQGAGCADAAQLELTAQTSEETWAARRDDLALLKTQLPPPESDPEQLLQTQKEALADVQRRGQELQRQEMRLQVEIERAQAEGRYERLSRVEEELSVAQDELRRLRVEAYAVKLLRRVMTERRENRATGQLPQLEEAITRMLQAITLRPRPVRLGPDFAIQGLMDESGPDLHSDEHLSAGTREQLDLVARIALGEAYAREYGRTMMVLDDALLYTDPARHDRVKEILKIAARSLQIFILSSHRDRYGGIVPPECQFDLVALTQGAV